MNVSPNSFRPVSRAVKPADSVGLPRTLLSFLAVLAAFTILCVLPIGVLEAASKQSDLELTAKIVQAVEGVLPTFGLIEQQSSRPQGIRLIDADVTGNKVTLNFNKKILGIGVETQEFEEIIRRILFNAGEAIYGHLRDVEYFILVEGVPLNQLFREKGQRFEANASSKAAADMNIVIQSVSGRRIAISPGHGWYWNGSSWSLQRSYFWGIVEDFVNAEIIMYLNTSLAAGGADVRPTRNMSKSAGNGESGYPKWQEAARYYIKSLGAPSSIWNEPGYNHYSQDIRCRPLYANWVGADILVSLHNNGGGGTGTEIWYDTTNGYQVESQQLANILQSEIVGAIRSGYDSGWRDRGVKGANGSYGENRLATRPSVIIEIAFMDTLNPDNTALRNETFKSLVANAIKQGISAYFGAGPPTVATTNATDVAETAATLNATITDDGGASIDERRFDWGTTPSCSDGWTAGVTVNGNSFSYSLTGLQPDSTYYFRGWAHNSEGWGQGNVLSFTTLSPQTLSVSLSANPSSGTAPLTGVDLTATISGTATGTINYIFYRNRSDSGTNITHPTSFEIDGRNPDGTGGTVINWGIATGYSGGTTFTVYNVCDYTTAGTYTAKVIAERGSAPAAEDRVSITVTAEITPPMDLNNDGIVSFGDFGIFAFYWMDYVCLEPDWCEGSDSDQSGAVDSVDLFDFVNDWLWYELD